MTSDTISTINNQLQIVSLAMESIDEKTPQAIVIQRLRVN